MAGPPSGQKAGTPRQTGTPAPGSPGARRAAGDPTWDKPQGAGGEYGTGEVETKEEALEWSPAGDNFEYWSQRGTQEISWQTMLYDRLDDEIPAVAELYGENPDTYQSWFRSMFPYMIVDLEKMVRSSMSGGQYQLPGSPQLNSPEGIGYVYQMARMWLGNRDPRIVNAMRAEDGKSTDDRTGRGGGGGGRMSADQIRAQFDIDQLANNARDIWRGTLLDEPRDARGMAKAYVEAIVRNPDQKLDFETFITKQAEGTARYASLYRNKPAGMAPQQYLMPYLSQAQQMARPKEAVNIAAGGAQLGADPNAFRSRLGRTNAVTTSAPFISSMEQRMAGLKRVLKG